MRSKYVDTGEQLTSVTHKKLEVALRHSDATMPRRARTLTLGAREPSYITERFRKECLVAPRRGHTFRQAPFRKHQTRVAELSKERMPKLPPASTESETRHSARHGIRLEGRIRYGSRVV